MLAWSQVFDAATIALGDGVAIVQLRRLGKGCLSYVVLADGAAAVIDPSWHTEEYTRESKHRGAEIRAVIDTHLHADHVSGARRLAHDTGARLYLGSQEAFEFDGWTRIADGDAVPVGSIHLDALAAPGHTPGSLLWRIDDSALFTGDVLFLSAIGRPDLHGNAEQAARHLYKSLRRIAQLPGQMLILPGHAPEDDDAPPGTPHTRPLDAVMHGFSDLLGEEETFVTRASRVPAPPPNADKILETNRRGEPIPDDEVLTLEAGPNRCAAQA
jgi:glyoxylase-like metal-dependent hydrolase (beta-lactamase superfamily II)